MTARDTEAMAAIEAMVQRIVERFHPLKVILFRSYAVVRGRRVRDAVRKVLPMDVLQGET